MSDRQADLQRIIRRDPAPTARLLRAVSKLPSKEIERLAQLAERRRSPSSFKKKTTAKK